MKSGFTWLDSVVLFVYLVGITLFGLWMARKIKSSNSYFMGDRKFNWWLMMGLAFGTGTHAEMPVAQTGAVFQNGFATIWYQWKNMLITPFYWLLAPWYRRSERTTIGEMIEDRYGRQLGLIYSVFAIAFFVFNQGAMLQGAGKIISVATGDAISSNGVVLSMTAAFIIFSFFGGLMSTAYTDFIQAFMIIILSMMLIPLGLGQVGGFSGLHTILASKPDFFELYNVKSGLTAFTIAMLAVNGVVGITAQPHILSMCATGNNERAGRIGQTHGALVKRLCTIGWALTGLIVAAMVIERGVTLPDPEAAFGYACRELLFPGLTGLLAASVLAANMSTCSTFMVNTGALFTRNFYMKYINPGANDRTVLWTGRISGFVLTLLGVLFALTVKNVLHAFLFTETIAAFMGIIVFGGVLWKRANRYGALWSVLTAFVVYYALNFNSTGKLLLVYKWKPEPFGWAMLWGFVVFIVLSLLTRPEKKACIDLFFDRMSRLSDDDKKGPDDVKSLAAESGHDLLFLDLPGWLKSERWSGFFKRYREDIVGFIIAWGVVALIVALAYGILQIGT
ncbi:sodium:solute symporter family protein [candidate division KSB1 bacterium]|nr:sodium:solute symporter family protein [candidate division KSB1 bacterium]